MIVWENPFKDVKESDWFYPHVGHSYKMGVLLGMGKGRFRPDASLTRAMVCTALARFHGEQLPQYLSYKFADVPSGKYFAPAVRWANENLIMLGISDDKFGPNRHVPRQELAMIVSRYIGFAEMQLPAVRGYIVFADEAQIAGYANYAVQTLGRAGIIVGKPGDKFDPVSDATRGEFAAILHRLADLI